MKNKVKTVQCVDCGCDMVVEEIVTEYDECEHDCFYAEGLDDYACEKCIDACMARIAEFEPHRQELIENENRLKAQSQDW